MAFNGLHTGCAWMPSWSQDGSCKKWNSMSLPVKPTLGRILLPSSPDRVDRPAIMAAPVDRELLIAILPVATVLALPLLAIVRGGGLIVAVRLRDRFRKRPVRHGFLLLVSIGILYVLFNLAD